MHVFYNKPWNVYIRINHKNMLWNIFSNKPWNVFFNKPWAYFIMNHVTYFRINLNNKQQAIFFKKINHDGMYFRINHNNVPWNIFSNKPQNVFSNKQRNIFSNKKPWNCYFVFEMTFVHISKLFTTPRGHFESIVIIKDTRSIILIYLLPWDKTQESI